MRGFFPLAGIAGGLSLVAAGVVAAMASSGSLNAQPVASTTPSGQSRTNYCQDFTSHLAHDLGISASTVSGALAQAGEQTLNDAVKNGTITQKRADAIKARAARGQACTQALGRLAGTGGQGVGRSALMQAAAHALGTTPDQLRGQLSLGKPVSQIAPPGMTEQQFATALQNALKGTLDARVKAGAITQARENALLGHVPAIAQRLWTSGARHPHPKPTPTA
jgi:hypothetical protein